MASSSSSGLPLGQTYGAMLLSTIIVSALYGITTLQALYYYEKFPEDSRTIKSAVFLVWVLDTLTIVLDAHAVYYYLISNYNNPIALGSQVWSLPVEVLTTYTVVLIAQMFFILRIYQLRRYAWYIPAALGAVAIASYCTVIPIMIQIFEASSQSDAQSTAVDGPVTANWVLGMITDIGITVVLCWYLWSEKVYVRQNTHRVINRIIIFSVHRGAIAAVVQVFTLLLKFIAPQNFAWLAFHNALSKVYANSMLATLNSRVALRGMMADGQLDSAQLTPPTIRQSRPSVGHGVSVRVDIEAEHSQNLQIASMQFALQPARASTCSTLDDMDIVDQNAKGSWLGSTAV
ncbi:hypothetical protein BV20DRAFT_1119026 [Pilatotrama ljubarskyi]|nr:hypothetical protein BV20DRAFT_1119026 [Pilatotrama ljubarskyi]